MPENVIEVVLKAVDQMSGPIGQLTTALDKFTAILKDISGESTQVSGSLDRISAASSRAQSDFIKSKESAAQFSAEIKNLDKTLQSFGQNIPTAQLRQFVLETSKTSGVSTGTVTDIFGQLGKKIGQFASAPDLEQLTQGIIKTSKTFGTDLNVTTAETIKVLSGLSNQVKDTNISIDRSTPIAERAGAVISAMGVHAKDTESSLGRLGSVIVVANQALELFDKTFGRAIEFFKEASQDAGRFEQEIVGLTNTFEIFGKTANPENLIEFSDEMRKTQGVSRELALDITKDLATFTDLGRGADASGEKLKKLTAITIALAKTTGRSPEFQSLQIANFLSNPAINSFGRGLNAPAGLTLDEKQNYLIERYGGLVEQAVKLQDTFIGQQLRLKLAIEGVGHVIGGEANQSLKVWNSTLADAFTATEKWLEENKKVAEAIGKLGIVLGATATILTTITAFKFIGLIKEIEIFGTALSALVLGPLGEIALAIGLIIAAVTILKTLFPPADYGEAKIKQAEDNINKLRNLIANPSFKDPSEEAKRRQNLEKEIEGQSAIAQRAREKSFGKILFDFDPADAEQHKKEIESKADDLYKSILDKSEKAEIGARASIIRVQGDLAANAQKLIFDETGSTQAMLNSFDIKIRTIRAENAAKVAAATQAIAIEAGVEPHEVAGIPKLAESVTLRMKADTAASSAAEQQVIAERQKFIFDQQNKAIEVQAALSKELLAVQEQLVANDKDRLKVLESSGAPLSERLALVKKIEDEQQKNTQRSIDDLAVKKKGYDNELTAISAQGIPLDKNNLKVAEILTKQTAITKELETQKGKIESQKLEAIALAAAQRAVDEKNITTELGAQLTALESLKALDERRIALLDIQATLSGKEHASYEDRVSLATQIDGIEQKILQTKIAEAQVKTDTARGNLADNPNNEALQSAADAATATLNALIDQALFVKTKVMEIEAEIVKEGRETAKSLSQEFADQLIQGITGALNGQKGGILKALDNLFIAAGKSIVTQFIQEGIQHLITPYTTALAKQGEKPNTIAGLLGGALKNFIGLGSQQQKLPEGFGAHPVSAEGPLLPNGGFFSSPQASSATLLSNAGATLKSSADTLLTAGQKLIEAATAITNIKPQTGGISSNADTNRISELNRRIDAAITERNNARNTPVENDQQTALRDQNVRQLNTMISALVNQRDMEIQKINETRNVRIVDSKIIETNLSEVSPQAANAIEDAVNAQSNVKLGPSGDINAGQLDSFIAAIEDLKDTQQTAPVSQETMSTGSNMTNINNILGGDNGLSLGGLTGIAGQIQQLVGSQGGGIFGKIGTGAGLLGSLYKSLSGLDLGNIFGGGGTNIFGQFPFPVDATGIDAAAGDYSVISGGLDSGGFFSSIGDFISGLFSHDGGPIDKYMHGGGYSGDDVPIIAQHGEYMLQRSAVNNIGKSVLDKINETGRLPTYHAGGGIMSSSAGMKVPSSALSKLSSPSRVGAASSEHGTGAGEAGPMRSSVSGSYKPEPIHQNIFIVDRRPAQTSANDIIATIENDMVARNGKTARAVQHVLQRSR